MDGASWGLKAVDLTTNEKSWGQISVLTEILNIHFRVQKLRKITFKPCGFQWQILIKNKVNIYTW